MPVLEKKKIGTTEITGGKGKKTPAPPPSEEIAKFIKDHKKLKDILKTGTCQTIADLMKRAGIEKNDMALHLRLFRVDGYAVKIEEEKGVVCSTEAVKRMMELFEKMRRG